MLDGKIGMRDCIKMDKKIRVLHTECTNSFGGQEIRIINEILMMQSAGFEMFLAAKKDKPLAKEAKKRGIKVFELPFRGYWDIETFLKLIYLIKKYNIDIINTHGSQNTWLGGIAGKLSGIKFVRSRHMSVPISKSKLNFINRLADFIITTGEHIKENMIKDNGISPEKIVSIPSSVDVNIFNPEIYDKHEARAKFGLDKKALIVGKLAHIREQKGFQEFIEVAGILAKKYTNLLFVIGGDGNEALKERLKKRIKTLNIEDRVIFLGHIDNPELFLKAIDIFLFTSHTEGLPQSVTQALMMNLPTIATNVGSTSDLSNGKNMILVEAKDVDGISKALENLIISPEVRESLSKIARNSIVNSFSLESMRDKTISVYKKVLD